MQVSGQDAVPEDHLEGSPFGELFKRDPGMKDLFRRGQPQRAHHRLTGWVRGLSWMHLASSDE